VWQRKKRKKKKKKNPQSFSIEWYNQEEEGLSLLFLRKLKMIAETGTHTPTKPYRKGHRRAWPRHHKISILKAIYLSPLPLFEACQVAGINVHRYRKWRDRLAVDTLYGTYDLCRSK